MSTDRQQAEKLCLSDPSRLCRERGPGACRRCPPTKGEADGSVSSLVSGTEEARQGPDFDLLVAWFLEMERADSDEDARRAARSLLATFSLVSGTTPDEEEGNHLQRLSDALYAAEQYIVGTPIAQGQRDVLDAIRNARVNREQASEERRRR